MKNNDKKYKYTKQILNVAIEVGGYTNSDIAVKAGLSGKSVALVSAWRNGRKEATERQMAYFIKEYEHLVMRKIEQLFYSVSIEDGKDSLSFRKLSGEVIFKHQVKIKNSASYSSKSKSKPIGAFRLVILKIGAKFHVVQQYRAGLIQLVERETSNGIEVSPARLTPNEALKSDNEEANWFVCQMHENVDLDEVVNIFNEFKNSLLTGDNLIDFANLPGADLESSQMFKSEDMYSMEFTFYQKMLKLGLNSELFPF